MIRVAYVGDGPHLTAAQKRLHASMRATRAMAMESLSSMAPIEFCDVVFVECNRRKDGRKMPERQLRQLAQELDRMADAIEREDRDRPEPSA